MSLSRVLAPGLHGPKAVAVSSKRTDIHIPRYYDPEEHKRLEKIRAEYLGEGDSKSQPRDVGFIGRLIARFKGEALPGEKKAPVALFQNVGMHWLPPKPLPKVPADYKENPERDIVNFPFPARHMFAPKARFITLPESWFQAFYNVTGSSGPYLFIASFGAFLVNKEFVVYDENVCLIFVWILYYIFIRNAWGPAIDEYGYKNWDHSIESYKKVIKEDLESVDNFKKIQAARKDALTTAKENFPAILKENMELQLEVTYRKNVEKVAVELKRRLDYLKDTETVKNRLERNIYVHQIIDGVNKVIDNNEGGIKDAYLDYCIEQLKTLSNKEIA